MIRFIRLAQIRIHNHLTVPRVGFPRWRPEFLSINYCSCFALWLCYGIPLADNRQCVQSRFSHIKASRLRLGSRKKAIHSSWSGILAKRCGSTSKATPRAASASRAAWMSATLK